MKCIVASFLVVIQCNWMQSLNPNMRKIWASAHLLWSNYSNNRFTSQIQSPKSLTPNISRNLWKTIDHMPIFWKCRMNFSMKIDWRLNSKVRISTEFRVSEFFSLFCLYLKYPEIPKSLKIILFSDEMILLEKSDLLLNGNFRVIFNAINGVCQQSDTKSR